MREIRTPQQEEPKRLPEEAGVRKRRPSRWHRWHTRLLAGFEVVVAFLLLCGILLQWAVRTEEFPRRWFAQSTLSLVLLDRDGTFLYEKPSENGLFGNWLPKGKLPQHIRWMTLAAEDHRINEHDGVDAVAIVRAMWGNWLKGYRRSGASTLAMQLVRRLRPRPRTYWNKINEMYWALVLQLHLKPEGILREYLNRAPYGNRVQGIHRAALLYFDRPTADLSLAQAAFLSALPWGPSALNPFRSKGRHRAWQRAKRILKRAHQLKWISKQQYKEALLDPIRIEPRPKRPNTTIHFTQRISRQWKRYRRFKQADQRITTLHTTLDLKLQRKVQDILSQQLIDLQDKGAGTGAVMVVDYRSGEILSYVGSHSYFNKKQRGSIDYIQTKQSPGSTLKPFVYAQAIDRLSYTGATLLADIATGYLWRRGAYLPQNDDTRFLGPLRMRVALGNSRNIPALRTLSEIGVHHNLQLLRGLGIRSLHKNTSHYGLGLAIGSAEIRLIELVRAYATLARGGKPIQLQWARSAVDSLGRSQKTQALFPTLFAFKRPTTSPKLSQQAAQVISRILSDPVARMPSFGRHTSLEYPFPVAVKTGSSQGYRNAWTMAYSDRIVVGCWIGSHDRHSMRGVSGARGCGPVVHKVMVTAMKRVDPHQPPKPFVPPKGWSKQQICPLSGQPVGPQCPGSVEEWFPPHHTHKYKSCLFHRKIRIDRRNGLRAGLTCTREHTVKRPYVVVPPLYAEWAATLKLPQPPRRYSPMCPKHTKVAKTKELRIRYPLNQARYIKDPTIPKEYATIALKAISRTALQQVVWYHNDKLLGRAKWPYTLRWSLQQGTHRFVATSPDGTLRSKPVIIHVH